MQIWHAIDYLLFFCRYVLLSKKYPCSRVVSRPVVFLSHSCTLNYPGKGSFLVISLQPEYFLENILRRNVHQNGRHINTGSVVWLLGSVRTKPTTLLEINNSQYQNYFQNCLRFRWLLSSFLTLSMLRLLLSKAQEFKNLGKSYKPYHLGIHRKALIEFSQMSTHLPGFRSFFSFSHIILYWSNRPPAA